MKITTARRISQLFFFILFLWFSIVSSLGENWWQLRGWPVNWLIQLDPLVGLGTVLTTRTLYKGLLWGVLTIVLTLVLGRFFCGWICPFGTLHQTVGWWGQKRKKHAEKIKANQYRKSQNIKYWILIFLLCGAAGDLLNHFLASFGKGDALTSSLVAAVMIAAVLYYWKTTGFSFRHGLTGLCMIATWGVLTMLTGRGTLFSSSLQTGLLDPIPLFLRSVNLVILPILDSAWLHLSPAPRFYPGALLIGGLFLIFVLLNLVVPRFYCRFICPLGALFALLSKNTIWRVGKNNLDCIDCGKCETNCEGGCSPTGRIRVTECVLCMNCITCCPHGVMGYHTRPSQTEAISRPDISRRSFLTSMVSGLAAVPMINITGSSGPLWHPDLIRPPGALAENDFLNRCIKCGQCMRICPSNVIQPAGLATGIQELWTPALNFRMGTSGCQRHCIACGNLCPTAAIRPITLDERLGRNRFAEQGPLKIGTAFVDRGRCLPWAMDRPCIVCQENCPVSPKAIHTRNVVRTVQTKKPLMVVSADEESIELDADSLVPGRFATGDYVVTATKAPKDAPLKILANTDRLLMVVFQTSTRLFSAGDIIKIQIQLQQPFVNPEYCIGCGICEHECPVKGRRAIRVSAENETRSRSHALLI